MRLLVIAFCVFSLAACSTVAEKPKSASAEAAAGEGASPAPAKKMICRDVSTTGSYGPRHECHTKEQWEKIDALS